MAFRSLSALARLLHVAAFRPLPHLFKPSSLGLVATALLIGTCVAQPLSTLERLYDQAAAQTSGPQRIAALEDVAQRATGDPLRVDALELLVWEYARSNPQQAGNAARELLAADEANPMAIAVLKSGAGVRGSESKSNHEDTGLLQVALQNLGRLHRPRAVSTTEYAAMQRWSYALLSGAAGMAYFDAKDYVTARTYLRNALVVMPEDGTWNYALALADLEGDNSQAQAGFQELARAVVLTQSREVAEFALAKYEVAGGTAGDWNRYVVAARASLLNMSSNRLPQIALTNFDVPQKARANRQVKQPSNEPSRTARRSKPQTKPDRKVEDAINREPTDSAPNAIPEIKERRVVPFPPGEPVSLGILLEASVKKDNRDEVVQGLSDVVRRLRPKDEAFVLAFGDQLAFEQDLTQNYRLLEQAVDEIKPDSGTALYDAVGFAAGHLKRIAKNRNQVLLVISDGQNRSSRESSFRLAAQLENVKIYCIGVGAAAENKYALESLANYTGGQVAFVTTPNQFEPALQSLAETIYGPYPVQQSRR